MRRRAAGAADARAAEHPFASLIHELGGSRKGSVSDVSRGPGWWRASDGMWYPPESHPRFRGDAQATGSDELHPSKRPGWWVASDGRRYPPHLHPTYRPLTSQRAEAEPAAATVATAAIQVDAPAHVPADDHEAPKAVRRKKWLPRAKEGAVWVGLAVLVIAAAASDFGKDQAQSVASGSSTTQAAPTSTGGTIEIKTPPEGPPATAPDGGKDGGQGVGAGPSTTAAAPTQALAT